jgi:trehalose/maltose hydrolase-like predicted phosphorylase
MLLGREERDWTVSEDVYAPERARYFETVFTLANGFLGVRGSSEEGSAEEHAGSYLAGVFNRAGDEATELVNIPAWLGTSLSADGRLVTPRKGRLLAYRRWLDMKNAVLVREFRVRQQRRTTRVRIERFVSRSDTHTAAIRYTVTPENYSARLSFESSLDARVTNSGRKHLKVARLEEFVSGLYGQGGGILLEVETLESKVRIAQAATTKLSVEGSSVEAARAVSRTGETITEVVSFDAERGREYVFDKLVTFFTSRDGFADPAEVAAHCAGRQHERGYDALFAAHRENWKDVWQRSDVRIDGDDAAQRAARFSIFHSAACAPVSSDKVSLGAKGLHGEGYKGHVFWDCEIFNAPLFIYSQPEVARNLLMYRYHTLPGARRKAKSAGYRGAMYAWESADTGDETTPQWITHFGQQIRVLCGDIEQHISADVAYAVRQYYEATRDDDFLLNYGAEIIFETARFWVSRFEYNLEEDRQEIRRVIGPDEYHENVDNSVFTNAMARWNIRLALDLADDLKRSHPREWLELKDKLHLSDHRMRVWRRVAEKVYIPFSKELNVYEQFDGFLALDRVDISQLDARDWPVDVLLGRERTIRSQVIKQADVVMMLFLLGGEFDEQALEANFDYYAPICGHGSSLSPSVHSIVASRLGRVQEALGYFERSASIDLAGASNCDSGLHLASLGGNWQSIVFGFCGVTARLSALAFAPRLPAHWRAVSFSMRYQGTPVGVTMTAERLTIDLSSTEAGRYLPVEVNGHARLIECGRVHTLPLGPDRPEPKGERAHWPEQGAVPSF